MKKAARNKILQEEIRDQTDKEKISMQVTKSTNTITQGIH